MLNKIVRKGPAERVTFEQKEVRKEAFQAERTASAHISKQELVWCGRARRPMWVRQNDEGSEL